jgi:hypothetical protein
LFLLVNLFSEKDRLYHEGKAFAGNKNGRKGNGKAEMGELGGAL